MNDGRPPSIWAPWAGLFLGATAWFLHHQAGSEVNFWDCRVGGAGLTIGVGLACAAVAAVGGVISWRAAATGAEAERQNRRFAAMVGAAGAGVFLLAIAFQTLAGAMIPACLR